jgi:hypothetical protein
VTLFFHTGKTLSHDDDGVSATEDVWLGIGYERMLLKEGRGPGRIYRSTIVTILRSIFPTSLYYLMSTNHVHKIARNQNVYTWNEPVELERIFAKKIGRQRSDGYRDRN